MPIIQYYMPIYPQYIDRYDMWKPKYGSLPYFRHFERGAYKQSRFPVINKWW